MNFRIVWRKSTFAYCEKIENVQSDSDSMVALGLVKLHCCRDDVKDKGNSHDEEQVDNQLQVGPQGVGDTKLCVRQDIGFHLVVLHLLGLKVLHCPPVPCEIEASDEEADHVDDNEDGDDQVEVVEH